MLDEVLATLDVRVWAPGDALVGWNGYTRSDRTLDEIQEENVAQTPLAIVMKIYPNLRDWLAQFSRLGSVPP